MTDDLVKLWRKAARLLDSRKPEKAICYLAEIVSSSPMDRQARLELALALGDAGHPAAALAIIRALAERLAHDGYLLPAVAVMHKGLGRAADDPGLLQTLQSIHVRGVRAKAGLLAVPPPLPMQRPPSPAATASALLSMKLEERLARTAEIGVDLPPAGPGVAPTPMPLFCELELPAFVATVRRLQYHAVGEGTKIIEEGGPGDSLLILVSGRVVISRQGAELAHVGPGAVLGEMALITRVPRSATATAVEPVEYFALARADVAELGKVQPKVLEELVAYCRRRLLLNVMRTSPLFTQFDEATRSRLLERFQTVTCNPGQAIISRGQSGTGLYVIASGSAQVQVHEPAAGVVTVAHLGPGDLFGEISLIRNQPTTADVIADDRLGAIFLPAQTFHQVLAEYPQIRQYLETLSADRLKASRDACDAGGFVDPDDVVVL